MVALGSLFGRLGVVLGRSWEVLGRSWAVLGRSWAVLGRSWAVLGRSPVLGDLGAVLVWSWDGLGRSWVVFGLPLLPRRTRNKLAGITFHFHFRSFFAFSKTSETTTGVGPERFSAARAPGLVGLKAPKTASSDFNVRREGGSFPTGTVLGRSWDGLGAVLGILDAVLGRKCFVFGLCSVCFALFVLFGLLEAVRPEVCSLQSVVSLLCRTHSLQSATGLLSRTHSALSVFSCSGLGRQSGHFRSFRCQQIGQFRS